MLDTLLVPTNRVGPDTGLAPVSELPAPVTVNQSSIAANWTAACGFVLHFVRELDSGILAGTRGLAVRCGGALPCQVRAKGELSLEPLPVGDARVYRLTSDRPCSLAVQVGTPGEEGAAELTAALLNLHSQNWLESVIASTGSQEWKQFALDRGLSTVDLAAFGAYWNDLGSDLAAEIWYLAGRPDGLDFLVAWARMARSSPAEAATSQWWRFVDRLPAIEQLAASAHVRHVMETLRAEAAANFSAADVLAALAGKPAPQATRQWIEAQRKHNLLLQSAPLDAWSKFASDLWQAAAASFARSIEADWRARLAPGTGQPLLVSNLAEDGSRLLTPAPLMAEIQLPLVDRATVAAKPPLFERTIRVSETGVLRVEPPPASEPSSQHDIALAVTFALRNAFAPRDRIGVLSHPRLDHTLTRAVQPGLAADFYTRALSHFGLSQAAAAWFADHPQELTHASLTLSLDGEALEAWTRPAGAPGRTALSAWNDISIGLQRIARRWLPALYFESAEVFRAPQNSVTMLAYHLLEPVATKARYHFGYDILDTDSMRIAWRWVAKRLQDAVRPIEPRVRAAGFVEAANSIRPAYAPQWIPRLMRSPRYFHSLLAAETFMINSLIHLNERGLDLQSMAGREPGKAVRNLARYSDEFVRGSCKKLRHTFPGMDATALIPVYLLCATAQLQRRTTSHRLHATLRLDCGAEQAVHHSSIDPARLTVHEE